MILATAEEEIRQDLVGELVEAGIALPKIDLEVPLKIFQKGKQGRADIIVYKENTGQEVELLIECKSRKVPLTDDVFDQALRYNEVVNARLIILANGRTLEAYEVSNDQSTLLQVNEIRDLNLHEKTLEAASEFVYERVVANREMESAAFMEKASDFTTGAPTEPNVRYLLDYDSKKEVKCLGLRLMDLLYDLHPSNILTRLESKTCDLVEDRGDRFGRYSTYGGYSFTEFYRYFLVKDKEGNHFTLNFAIYAYDMYNTESKEIFRSGPRGTYLMTGYDNQLISSHSLELNLDKFTRFDKSISFWHNGRITVTSSQPNQVVKDYLLEHQPDLLKNNQIYLGDLPLSGALYFSNEQVIRLFSRIIDYVVLREKLKLEIRARRK